MASESAKKFEQALVRKGFRLERRTKDKIFYFYYQDKKTEVFTKISEGRGEDLRDKLLGLIKRQMFLDSLNQLRDFIDCALTEEQYIAHLRNKEVLGPSPGV